VLGAITDGQRTPRGERPMATQWPPATRLAARSAARREQAVPCMAPSAVRPPGGEAQPRGMAQPSPCMRDRPAASGPLETATGGLHPRGQSPAPRPARGHA